MIILKKIWLFLKTHWYIPVIIVVGLILKGQSDKMLKIIDASKKSYNKQKEAIEWAAGEKENKKQKIDREYDDAVRAIETVYKVQKKNLEENKKKEIKNIVEKYYNEPEELSSQISDLFGLTYVPRKNNNNTD